MGFIESRFPVGISYGSSGGPGHRTEVTELDSGAEQRVSMWANARRTYDARHSIVDYDDLFTIQEFIINTRGAAHGFRFKDHTDYASTSNGRTTPTSVAFDDQLIGAGDGTTTQFQLLKRYVLDANTVVRTIQKPVSGTIKVGVNGVEKTSGVDFTVNTTTGVVTFVVAPPNGHDVTAGFEFDVPVRFGIEVDKVLAVSLDAVEDGSIPSIPLIEIVNPSALAQDFPYGGSKTHDPVTADIQITINEGRLHVFDNVGSGHAVILQDYTNLPGGSPYYALKNEDATNSLDIQNHLLSSIATLGPGDYYQIDLLDDNGTKSWQVLG